MKVIFRCLGLFLLLIAAITAYSAGHQTGAFLFVVLGFVLEGVFWTGLFPRKRAG